MFCPFNKIHNFSNDISVPQMNHFKHFISSITSERPTPKKRPFAFNYSKNRYIVYPNQLLNKAQAVKFCQKRRYSLPSPTMLSTMVIFYDNNFDNIKLFSRIK